MVSETLRTVLGGVQKTSSVCLFPEKQSGRLIEYVRTGGMFDPKRGRLIECVRTGGMFDPKRGRLIVCGLLPHK